MKFIKKRDFIIVIVLLVVSCIGLYIYANCYSNDEAKAEVYYGSNLIMTIMLNEKEDRLIKLPQNENVSLHQYEDGSIAFEASDCPDKVCIKSGKLSHIGSSTACLPNKVILKIVPVKNSNNNETDLIIGNK